MSEDTRVFLSQCMHNRNILADTLVTVSDFPDKEEAQIFQAILDIAKSGSTPDAMTVASHLGKKYHEFFELEKLAEITSNWKYYEDSVIEQSKRLKMRKSAEEVLNNPHMDYEDMLALLRVAQDNRSYYKTIETTEAINNSVCMVAERAKKGSTLVGVTSGLKGLDELTLGFQDSNLYYLGARPSMGKSMILLNFMAECKVPCGFLSAESSYEEIIFRLLARQSRINSMNIISGKVTQDLLTDVFMAGEQIKKEMKFQIYDEPNMSIEKVISKAWDMKRNYGIKILFVDYIQIIGSERNYSDVTARVRDNSLILKGLARDLKIPIVCAAQLRRDKENDRPTLQSFSDSTQLERDADIAMFIHEQDNKKYLLVEKSRNGVKHDIPLDIVYPYMLVREGAYV